MKFDHMYNRDRPVIPPLEDSTSVLLAIGQVVRALNYETMELKRGGLMLYGLQIAAGVAARMEQPVPADCVRSIHNLEGDPLDFSEAFKFGKDMLAPENLVCEPPHDCPCCPQKDSCRKRNSPNQEPDQEPDQAPSKNAPTLHPAPARDTATATAVPTTARPRKPAFAIAKKRQDKDISRNSAPQAEVGSDDFHESPTLTHLSSLLRPQSHSADMNGDFPYASA
jgi:hypothetical protein